MARWPSSNTKLNSSLVLSQKAGVDLMQNCDLPPPLKVFSRSDKTVLPSMNGIFSVMDQEDGKEKFDAHKAGVEAEKIELLKALRLSQTRAREAEKKAAKLARERDNLSKAFLEESMRSFAGRQWVRLLELQVSKFKKKGHQMERQPRCSCGKWGAEKSSQKVDDTRPKEIIMLAICLGICGVGVAFGYRYSF